MNIEGCRIGIANTGAAHVGLVGYYESRRNLVYGNARSLVVIAYRGYDRCNILGGHAEIVKNSERHYRAALRMLYSVDEVAYIVKVARDPCKLYGVRVASDVGQYFRRRIRNLANVREAMLGEAEGAKRCLLLSHPRRVLQ